MTKAKVLQQFAEQIARMQTERETMNGFVSEDAMATVNDLIQSARELTGINPGHPQVYCSLCDSGIEDCDCEPAGQCLFCATQCSDEGICPICAAFEQAGERVREATADAVQAGLRGTAPAAIQAALRAAYRAHTKAKEAKIGSCRKCGKGLTLYDRTDNDARIDLGEGPEDGKVFLYCSEHCRDTH